MLQICFRYPLGVLLALFVYFVFRKTLAVFGLASSPCSFCLSPLSAGVAATCHHPHLEEHVLHQHTTHQPASLLLMLY